MTWFNAIIVGFAAGWFVRSFFHYFGWIGKEGVRRGKTD